jgi:hypothetical protein
MVISITTTTTTIIITMMTPWVFICYSAPFLFLDLALFWDLFIFKRIIYLLIYSSSIYLRALIDRAVYVLTHRHNFQYDLFLIRPVLMPYFFFISQFFSFCICVCVCIFYLNHHIRTNVVFSFLNVSVRTCALLFFVCIFFSQQQKLKSSNT